jgi:UDP-N-acetylglucosamine--N-acetylmuramyl-(pentapeptide) pyrophosphoryl-undecaprenol N-acetylglucosamine transferase
MWTQLVLLNIRDSFLVVVGILQSMYKLIIWRPNVIFAKGGYVCLPVGLAARVLRIPLVIHDSDAYPGLTSRVLSRWSKSIATGAPLEYYNYPRSKSEYIGIPISSDFHRFSPDEQTRAKKEWGINEVRPLIVVTGGGLGAQRINDAVVHALDQLRELGSVVLIAGASQYDELRALTPRNDADFQLYPFVSDGMASLLGAADIVIARAGATTILELAALAKPTILIPNAKLTGGHQTKNAAVYVKANAVEIINEDEMVDDPIILVKSISALITNTKRLTELSDNISKFARPNAAKDMANMIINAASS